MLLISFFSKSQSSPILSQTDDFEKDLQSENNDETRGNRKKFFEQPNRHEFFFPTKENPLLSDLTER